MALNGIEPRENFPTIGTEELPAIFSDGETVLLCYEVAAIDGGGLAIVEFTDVVEFSMDPLNVDELSEASYPVKAWSVTEITGSEKAARWAAMDPRYWTISFSDMTLHVLFDRVRLAGHTTEPLSPKLALVNFLTSS